MKASQPIVQRHFALNVFFGKIQYWKPYFIDAGDSPTFSFYHIH